MPKKNWLADLELGDGVLLVKKTGAQIPLSWATFVEGVQFFSYYCSVELWRAGRFLLGQRGPSVAFSPDRPRPWYLIWPVLHAAGARIVDNPDKADFVVHFDDTTLSLNVPPPLSGKAGKHTHHLNFACTDISKSRVTRVFEEIFGYPLAVNPRAGEGPAVEKSEENAAHDGAIVHRPVEPRPGRVYQKLIDNRSSDGLVADLRTPTIGGRPVCVFIKERPIAHRFSNDNVRVSLRAPEDVFSAAEIESLTRFGQAMGLDWGGLDVLRDREDGRIYVVDANKTDMGPPFALPLVDKLRATRRLARAFESFVADKQGKR
jgi:hypothetical protein